MKGLLRNSYNPPAIFGSFSFSKLWPLLAALPALLFLAFFFYTPLCGIFGEALKPQDGVIPLQEIFQDPYYWKVLGFTAKQAAFSALGSLILGFPLGYILANRSFPGRKYLKSLTLIPFVLPSIVVALGFILFLGQNGVFNRVLNALFGIKLSVLYSLSGIILAHAFYNAPIVARSVHASWENLSPCYEEAAGCLGAGSWRRFVTVTLPLIMPGVITGTLLSFIFSFFSFPIVLSLGGARYTTLEVEVYRQVRVLLNFPAGSGLALLQTVLSLSASFIYLSLERKFTGETSPSVYRTKPPLFRITPFNALLWIYLALASLIFLGPIAAVIFDSFYDQEGFSIKAYRFILADEYNAHLGDSPLKSIFNSLGFGGITVVFSLILGMGISGTLALWRKQRSTRILFGIAQVLEVLCLAPIAVSSVAFGFAALRASRSFAWQIFSLTPESLIPLIHTVLALPFVIRTLRPAFERMDYSYVEAARVLGSSKLQTFTSIQLPLAQPSIMAAGVFAFAISLSEMSATIMLARPGLMSLPLSIHQLVAARHFQSASALSVILMIITALSFLGIEWLTSKLTYRSNNGK
jgi:thiamine transport system permease protein